MSFIGVYFRMLYWCEARGIMAAGMDGTDQTILSSYVVNISGLTVDTKGE